MYRTAKKNYMRGVQNCQNWKQDGNVQRKVDLSCEAILEDSERWRRCDVTRQTADCSSGAIPATDSHDRRCIMQCLALETLLMTTVTVTVTEALVLRPYTKRPRAYHRVNLCLGARRQNETEMFSDHDETSPSIAAVSAPSVACSMLAMHALSFALSMLGCSTYRCSGFHRMCIPDYTHSYSRRPRCDTWPVDHRSSPLTDIHPHLHVTNSSCTCIRRRGIS